ncbi:transglycosylase SLT domain-containing protein [Streptomyces olivaceus]|nr:transglycosylase SLT domain-containing protein [Streptomyces olivaceus]
MSKLAPNAQSFVRAVQALGPAWDDMKLSVQNRLFEGLDQTVTTLGRATIPVLKRGLTETAGVWNAIAKNAAGAITEMAKSGLLDQILDGATANLRAFEKAPAQIITALGQLSVAAQPAFNALSQQMAGALTSFTDGIAKSFASGGLEQAIGTAIGILGQFGTLLGNILGTVSEVFKAASDAGGEIVGVLGAVFGELRRILASDEMQAQLRSLFGSVAQIVSAIVPVIGAVVQAVVPLLAAIAAPIAQVAQVLGPVLIQVAQSLGAALLPVIQSLGPVLVTVGTAIVQLVQAVTPLLQPIGDLIAGVINALAPALTPIVNVITGLVGVLIGPLTSIVQALTPALTQIGQIIAQVFAALEPMLQPLVTLIGQVAELIAGVFAQALQQLMPVLTPLIDAGMLLVSSVFEALQPLLPVVLQALEMVGGALLTMIGPFAEIAEAAGLVVAGLAPLIPVGVQLVTEVLGALIPVLPVIAGAFLGIADAALALIVPLAELVGSLARQLAPIIADLTPILTGLIDQFVRLLANAVPPLTEALLILVQAVVPIIPLFGQIVGMVLQMGAGVLMQLLPAVLQLVQAGIDLTLALLPLVPPLAQLIALVVDLSVKVLAWLLPPLIQLVGFFVGQLAGALATVIGWTAGLVSGIASLISPVTRVGTTFRNFKDKVVIPVWNGVYKAVSASWVLIKTYVLYPIRDFFTKTVPGWAASLTVKVLSRWNALYSGALGAWGKVKSNVLYPMRDFFTKTVPGWGEFLRRHIVGSFDAARAGIKIAFDKIRKITKDPISFVVNTVYNKGIRKVWNLVTDAFGGKHLDELKGFATGGVYGVLPGYTPGRDVHQFVSPTGGRLGLSGGESIFRPEFTRAVGAGFVSYWNSVARSRGVAGVRQAMANTMGGGQAFKDGGILSGIGNALSGAWDKAKSAAKWIKDGFGAAISAGVKAVINPLINKIPGDTGFTGLLKDLSKGAVKRLVAGGKEGDKKASPNIQYSPTKGVEQWRPVVLQSLREVGQSPGNADRTLRRMQQESGGNPTIVNKWDSNWLAGYPSVGLMQVIGPTFRSYAGKYRKKGPFLYGTSVDPLANVYSSMRYALSAYGSLSKAYDRPGGYDQGGWMPPGWGFNGLTTPEAVFTPQQFQAFEGAANVGLAAAAGGAGSVHYEINARTADFTVADLERVTRVQNARARVGRPR